MSEHFWVLIPLLFLISLTYSSVGLGGGSSYSAFLYLFGTPLAQIPPVALFLNVVVSATALYRFRKDGHFVPKLVFPLLLTSVPATFYGSRLRLDDKLMSLLFAAVFVLIAFIILLRTKEIKPRFTLNKKMAWLSYLFFGAVAGLIAGLMGIGGGILLGPVLLLLGLAGSRSVAGTCSTFVLINSLIGLISHYLQGNFVLWDISFLGPAVFAGALLGSFLGTRRIPPVTLQKIVAFILLFISLKLGLGILA